MTDLIVALAILLTISTVAFFLARIIALRSPRYVSWLMAAAAAVFACGFGMLAHGKLVIAQRLPFSGAIILGNWIVPSLAVLAGIVVAQPRLAPWRRGLAVAVLLGFAAYAMVTPWLGSPVIATDHWTSDGVCLQSCAASCSPASAATLLRHHGIATTEPEMVAICLTREQGTPSLGVYRGLTLKTQQSPWRVEVVRGTTDELLRSGVPALLRIRLDDNDRPSVAPWAWSSGIGHAVVCYGVRPDGQIDIGDPAMGRVQWTRRELNDRWRGEGLRLVRR